MGWADFGLDLAALWGRHRRRADSRRFSLWMLRARVWSDMSNFPWFWRPWGCCPHS